MLEDSPRAYKIAAILIRIAFFSNATLAHRLQYLSRLGASLAWFVGHSKGEAGGTWHRMKDSHVIKLTQACMPVCPFIELGGFPS